MRMGLIYAVAALPLLTAAENVCPAFSSTTSLSEAVEHYQEEGLRRCPRCA